MMMYTIRYVHRNNINYVASNIDRHLIILKLIDSEFRMGHQISYDGKKIFNFTLNEETDAVIEFEGNEKKVYEYLLSI